MISRARGLGEGELEEGDQKLQTSHYRTNTRAVVYSMMTRANTAA